MKFKLDDFVIYRGEVFSVWDCSPRYRQYYLLNNFGEEIIKVDEKDLLKDNLKFIERQQKRKGLMRFWKLFL